MYFTFPLPESYLCRQLRCPPHHIPHMSVHPVPSHRKNLSFNSSFTKISFLEFLSFISSQVIPSSSRSSSVCFASRPLTERKCQISLCLSSSHPYPTICLFAGHQVHHLHISFCCEDTACFLQDCVFHNPHRIPAILSDRFLKDLGILVLPSEFAWQAGLHPSTVLLSYKIRELFSPLEIWIFWRESALISSSTDDRKTDRTAYSFPNFSTRWSITSAF